MTAVLERADASAKPQGEGKKEEFESLRPQICGSIHQQNAHVQLPHERGMRNLSLLVLPNTISCMQLGCLSIPSKLQKYTK